MKVLVLGSTGLLGQSLIKSLKSKKDGKKDVIVVGLARKNAEVNLDITNSEHLISALDQIKPNIIINSTALVDHNLCEEKPDFAYLINARPIDVLSAWSDKNSAYFIQISTDHYYVGDKNKKHNEEDKINIVNEYARTKYLGEKLALINQNSLVIRTNIVGFRNQPQPTFLEWALQSLKTGSKMNLFNDYFTSSIHVKQLAEIIFDIIKLKPAGTLNVSSSEVSSKETFIIALAKKFNLNLNNYNSIKVADSGLIKRAESLGLDTRKVESILGYKMPDLKEVIQSIYEEYLLNNKI